LELEDKAGQQRITLSTPYSNTYLRMGAPNADHELILHTGDNALLNANRNWDVVVGVNLDEHVLGDVKESYDGKKAERVGGDTVEDYRLDQTTTVGYTRASDYGSQTTYVRGTVEETYDGALSRTFKSGAKKTIFGDEENTISGAFTQHVGSKKHIIAGTGATLTYGVSADTVFGAANKNFIGGLVTMSAGYFQTLKLGEELSLTVANSLSIANGTRLTVTAGADISLKKNGACTLCDNHRGERCECLARQRRWSVPYERSHQDRQLRHTADPVAGTLALEGQQCDSRENASNAGAANFGSWTSSRTPHEERSNTNCRWWQHTLPTIRTRGRCSMFKR
jgi:hypothetical protein